MPKATITSGDRLWWDAPHSPENDGWWTVTATHRQEIELCRGERNVTVPKGAYYLLQEEPERHRWVPCPDCEARGMAVTGPCRCGGLTKVMECSLE